MDTSARSLVISIARAKAAAGVILQNMML